MVRTGTAGVQKITEIEEVEKRKRWTALNDSPPRAQRIHGACVSRSRACPPHPPRPTAQRPPPPSVPGALDFG